MKDELFMPKLPPLFVLKITMRLREFFFRLSQKMVPPYMLLFETTHSFWMSKAISVAGELEIAEIIHSGIKDVNSISEKSGTNPDALYRLLKALASEGIFKETRPKYFEMTGLSRALLKSGPTNNMVLHHAGSVNWKLIGEMKESIITGKPIAKKVLGDEIFDFLAKNPKENELFNNSMKNGSQMAVSPIMKCYNFSKYNKIIDVGGGNGFLISAILTKNKKAHGIVFDQPHVVEGAKSLFENLDVADRAETIEGNFFVSVPEGGDVYILKNILHDWDDEKSIQILKNIHKAAENGSKVLIIEAIVEGDNKPNFGKIMDLQMLVTLGGRERNEEEYNNLIEKSGFKTNKAIKTFAPFSIIEAVK